METTSLSYRFNQGSLRLSVGVWAQKQTQQEPQYHLPSRPDRTGSGRTVPSHPPTRRMVLLHAHRRLDYSSAAETARRLGGTSHRLHLLPYPLVDLGSARVSLQDRREARDLVGVKGDAPRRTLPYIYLCTRLLLSTGRLLHSGSDCLGRYISHGTS